MRAAIYVPFAAATAVWLCALFVCPVEVLKRQAEQYAQLFRIFRRYSDIIARVSFWDLHDGQSWLNDFPWKRVNHPLLFDRRGNPKCAFDAVISALNQPLQP